MSTAAATARPPSARAARRSPSTQRAHGPRAAEQRERILDALFEVMSSAGTPGASVTEIAEAAQIARGALHYYFESKDELRQALMLRLGDRYIERVSAVIDRCEARLAAGEALRTGGAVGEIARWHFAGEDDEVARLLAVWIDYWGQAPSSDAIGGVVLSVQERARTLCARAMRVDAPALIQVDDDALRPAAASVLAVIEGGLLQWRIAARSSTPLDRGALSVALAAAAAATVAAASSRLVEVHRARA